MNYFLNRELDKPFRERKSVQEVSRKAGVRPAVAWARLHKLYKGQITLSQVYARVNQ